MLIVIGSTINAIYSEFAYFLQARLFSPTALLVFIGFTIFAVAGLGFIGAVRESSKMILMVISFIIQFSKLNNFQFF
jgi:hypothetical protein